MSHTMVRLAIEEKRGLWCSV